MKVVVVVAVFPVFFASVSIIVSHFLGENLAKKPFKHVKIHGESEKLGPEKLWGQQMFKKMRKMAKN